MNKCFIVVICIILAAALCGSCGSETHSMPSLKDTAGSEQYDITVTVASVGFDSEEKLDVAQCPSTITVYPKGDKRTPWGALILQSILRPTREPICPYTAKAFTAWM